MKNNKFKINKKKYKQEHKHLLAQCFSTFCGLRLPSRDSQHQWPPAQQ